MAGASHSPAPTRYRTMLGFAIIAAIVALSPGISDGEEGATSASNQPSQSKESADHWAFQLPKKPTPPSSSNQDWAKSDLDRFILAELERRQIAPNSPADPRILIRRLSFDLTGLPPKPKEIDAFVADSKNNRQAAVEALVDRLLASPAFGERWGRHWLDVARYAESSGHERNFTYPHAWRYRDWVIDSFNADKPYDQFVREQIAGDLLPHDSREQHVEQALGTAFLALGPKNHLTGDSDNLDLIDDQIDTLSKSVLGLTVACARCHDHKYDPISTADYYALAGIFASTESLHGTVPGKGGGSNRLHSDLFAAKGDGERAKALLEQRKKERLDAEKVLDSCRKALVNIPRDNPTAEQSAKIEKLRKEKAEAEAKLEAIANAPEPEVEWAMAVREAEKPTDVPIRVKGVPGNKGDVVPRGFPAILTHENSPVITPDASGRAELAEWITSEENPLTARVMVNRIWKHLFGTGLVSSVDNFGLLGAEPSHPELLDWLAIRFIEDGWSIKSTIREIVTSQTYQLSSDHDEAKHRVDPDAISLWRMRPRRLEFEPLRDAMLAFSGELDPDRPEQGSVVAEMGDGCLERQVKTAPLEEPRPWRSIYLPVVRFYAPPMAEAFDCAPSTLATGERAVTTVPGQALFLLNNEFVTAQAKAAGARLAKMKTDEEDRIRTAFEEALGREPDSEELRDSLEFVSAYPTEEPSDAWTAFAQSLFATAEFRYVY